MKKPRLGGTKQLPSSSHGSCCQAAPGQVAGQDGDLCSATTPVVPSWEMLELQSQGRWWLLQLSPQDTSGGGCLRWALHEHRPPSPCALGTAGHWLPGQDLLLAPKFLLFLMVFFPTSFWFPPCFLQVFPSFLLLLIFSYFLKTFFPYC